MAGQTFPVFRKFIFILLFILMLISLVSACAAPPNITQTTNTSAAPVITSIPSSTTPAATTNELARPQGELIAAVTTLGNENFLPWKADVGSSQLCCLVYDYLIYYDVINRKLIPGVAESWDFAADALSITYHIRKGIQFHEGWGELTAADVMYYFETQARPESVGKMSQARSINSMELLDPYTLVLHFRVPQPTFAGQFSAGEGGISQGIACKKYIETAGEEAASLKPIGTGPFRMLENQLATYYKFEALDSHWRVVPEFKYVILRAVPEVSTSVAMLKTKEIDIATVPAEQMAGLKAVGLAVEVNNSGGSILQVMWGGISLPKDRRYNPDYHNKDPWTDSRVRKAMAIAIDRQAICNSILAGGAVPAGVPLFSTNMEKYQYPYDPATARQLLKDAGYPNGFTFDAMSYIYPDVPEAPRIMEALVAYWKQIGLEPKIKSIEYAQWRALREKMKTAGTVAISRISQTSDALDRAGLFLMQDGASPYFMDEVSQIIFKEGNVKIKAEERMAYLEKLNQYYYENVGPIPLFVIGLSYCWNPAKISPFPHPASGDPSYLEYVRHAQPLNTFRLFTPWPGR